MRFDYLEEMAKAVKGLNEGATNFKAHVDVTIEHLTNVRNKIDEDIRRLTGASRGMSMLIPEEGPDKIDPNGGPKDMKAAFEKHGPESETDEDGGEDDLEGALEDALKGDQKGSVG